jgi:hypothetical protein
VVLSADIFDYYAKNAERFLAPQPQRGGWSKQVAVKLDGWKHRTHEGDFNVYNAVCGFACTVAARIFRLPRCGWADSPVADHSGDFFADSLL